jgi:hypothetical protein
MLLNVCTTPDFVSTSKSNDLHPLIHDKLNYFTNKSMIHNKQTNQLSIAESGSYINTVYNSRKVKSSKNMIKEHKSRKEVEVYVATSQVHADIHTNRFQKLTNLSEMKIPQLRYKLSISNIHSTLLLPSSSIVTQEKEAHNTQH